jgi:hypothetical protein
MMENSEIKKFAGHNLDDEFERNRCSIISNINPDGVDLEDGPKMSAKKEEMSQPKFDPVAFFRPNPEHHKQIPVRFPKKIIFLVIFLFLTGTGLILGGLIELGNSRRTENSITFWIIGSFCFLPGSFYLRKIWLFYRAKTYEEKANIVRHIPNYK